jgi:DNA-binding NarL/FixJ family response regulator
MGSGLDIKLSIVEDDSRIRNTLKELFDTEPGFDLYQVHGSAEEALAYSYVEYPQVFIMDINLPGISGIQCVKQLKEKAKSSQFLMYTINDEDTQVFEALSSGANGYILKSSSPEQIIEAVKELMEGGAPMSSHVARRVINQFRTTLPDPKPLEALSSREQEVLVLLSQGLLYKEIAEGMGITSGTVKQHIHRIYGKLHVQNRTEAVNRFFGR